MFTRIARNLRESAPRTLLALVVLAGLAGQAHADAWCVTRANCKWWAQRYTANARTGCIGIAFPMCFNHQGSCGTAQADCSKTCPIGKAKAKATNGPQCALSVTTSGLGLAGEPITSAPRDGDVGKTSVRSSVNFDEATGTVTISLEKGKMLGLTGGLARVIEVFLFRDESAAPNWNETKAEGEPTDVNTVWRGKIALLDGTLTLDGFPPEGIAVSSIGERTQVTIWHAEATIQPNLPLDEFQNLAVKVKAGEEGR